MNTFPFKIFFICFAVLAILFFCFPINLFEGEIVLKNGIQETVVQAPLSLSYFVGLGFNEADMAGVRTFYLLPSGIILALCLLIGFPALVAYRFYLKRKK